jgi:hypothetical protein
MEIAMIRDSRFHTCTPKPTNLMEWRVQRAVRKFLDREQQRGGGRHLFEDHAPIGAADDESPRPAMQMLVAVFFFAVAVVALISWAVTR